MAWMYLILAGIFEMLGVTWINKWHRDKNRRALLLLAGGFMASFMFLSLAMRTLPASTALPSGPESVLPELLCGG